MVMPETIRVGPYRVPVVCDQAAIDRHRASCEDATIRGRFVFADHTIYVAPDQSADNRAAVLLHEVLHAVWFAAGGEGEDLTEERAVTLLYSGLLDTLRRNPQLVAYLTTEAG